MLSAKIVPDTTLKNYSGASHGLAQTQPDAFNPDLLAFIER
jgi:non-heme chloroperoxidase